MAGIEKSEIQGKVFILLRKDLEMPEGKLAAQVGHAMDLVWNHRSTEATQEELAEFQTWFDSGRRKIVLRLKDEGDMMKVKSKLKDEGVDAFAIYDFGINFFDGLTNTGLVVFPTTKELKALKRVRVY